MSFFKSFFTPTPQKHNETLIAALKQAFEKGSLEEKEFSFFTKPQNETSPAEEKSETLPCLNLEGLLYTNVLHEYNNYNQQYIGPNHLKEINKVFQYYKKNDGENIKEQIDHKNLALLLILANAASEEGQTEYKEGKNKDKLLNSYNLNCLIFKTIEKEKAAKIVEELKCLIETLPKKLGVNGDKKEIIENTIRKIESHFSEFNKNYESYKADRVALIYSEVPLETNSLKIDISASKELPSAPVMDAGKSPEESKGPLETSSPELGISASNKPPSAPVIYKGEEEEKKVLEGDIPEILPNLNLSPKALVKAVKEIGEKKPLPDNEQGFGGKEDSIIIEPIESSKNIDDVYVEDQPGLPKEAEEALKNNPSPFSSNSPINLGGQAPEEKKQEENQPNRPQDYDFPNAPKKPLSKLKKAVSPNSVDQQVILN